MTHADDGQLNALLDGELSAEEARAVEAHVKECAACAKRLEEARAFLRESGELLNVLAIDAAPSAPPTRIDEVPLVAPRDPRGPADSSSLRKSTEGTAPKTVKEVAVNIEGGTAMSPAIKPVTRADEPMPAIPMTPMKWKVPSLEKLAWAASLILCLGVGYLANEVYHLRESQRNIAASRVDTVTQVAAVPAAAPADRLSRAAGSRAAANDERRRDATAPAGGAASRSAGPAERHEVAARQPATPPKSRPASKPVPTFTRNEPAPAPAPQQAPPSVSSALGDLAAADRSAETAGAGVAQRRFAAGAAAPTAAAPMAAAEAPAAFRRITLEEAVRRLSGSIRLIDGMQPVRVEAGPGHLVQGADPARDVVRVTYTGPRGSRLVLDQQLGDTREGSFNGLMPGDTLVNTGEPGGTRVRWVDRKFWLSLMGSFDADSLRAIVARVR